MTHNFEELLKEISSNSPAPGGGSVAALSGCFGASLISMVCNLTIGKKKYKDVEEEFKIILGESEELRNVLLELSEKDVQAFNEVMAAYKINDEEEKVKSLEKAYKKAASVPHKTAVNCLRLVELARATTTSGNKNAQSDSAVGALMAFAGVKGAVLNVRINLKYIEDAEFKTKLTNEVAAIENKGHIILKEIMQLVDSELTL
jgi:formiminotetrahydrofolate cyclodeaminase